MPNVQEILTEQGFSYEEAPTIPSGMTMEQYRQSRGNAHELHLTVRITDHNLKRATGLIRRLLKRSTIEIVEIS